jgi:hypothetical protein
MLIKRGFCARRLSPFFPFCCFLFPRANIFSFAGAAGALNALARERPTQLCVFVLICSICREYKVAVYQGVTAT